MIMPRKLTQEQYILRAASIHQNKYDYSLTRYTLADDPIEIICPEHGPFTQQARSHAPNGKGCPRCGRSNQAKTQEQQQATIAAKRARIIRFTDKVARRSLPRMKHRIESAKSVTIKLYQALCDAGKRKFADRISYPLYYPDGIYSHRNIDFHCANHGPFKQWYYFHARGQIGCYGCQKEQLRDLWVSKQDGRVGTFYLIKLFNARESFYKAGVTFQPLEIRWSAAAGLGYKYEIMAVHQRLVDVGVLYDAEQDIIERFKDLQYMPQVLFGGRTECLKEAAEVLDAFRAYFT